MPVPERITRGMAGTEGHVFRYMMASGFLRPGDVALDAACGIGYGCEILSHVPGARCVGVDREEHADFKLYGNGGVSFEVADLTSYDPKFGYDLFVGFETIEHLPELGHYLGIAKRARRWVILSAPVVPTAARNPYHLRDFRPGEVPGMFEDGDWGLFQALGQPAELSEIYIFKRRSLEVAP